MPFPDMKGYLPNDSYAYPPERGFAVHTMALPTLIGGGIVRQPNDLWLGIWFLVQTFEGETQTEKDAAQDIRAICKLLDESEESGEEGASC